MPSEQAVTAPRFNTFHHQNSFNPDPDREAAFLGSGIIRVNDSIPEDVREELTQRGHEVETTGAPIAFPIMLTIDHATGTIHAAGDPQAGRHAAAINQ